MILNPLQIVHVLMWQYGAVHPKDPYDHILHYARTTLNDIVYDGRTTLNDSV